MRIELFSDKKFLHGWRLNKKKLININAFPHFQLYLPAADNGFHSVAAFCTCNKPMQIKNPSPGQGTQYAQPVCCTIPLRIQAFVLFTAVMLFYNTHYRTQTDNFGKRRTI
ncbi:MAG TPA: hypothetical protein VJ953_19145 [Saprospiraceae bacterium]|nr:hypothetical protein [Saprospiraceae bacterium]